MMRKAGILLLIMVIPLTGCIQFEFKEVVLMPTLFEVIIVTPTIPVPSLTNSVTPVPTITMHPTTELPPTETFTPSPSITISPTLTPTFTSTSPQPALVILNARCRFGPGVVYNVISYVSQGDQFFVEGRNADNSWYLIDRTGSGEFCWVTGSAIQIEGDWQRIKPITPPPTPTDTPQPTSPPVKRGNGGKTTGPYPPPGETSTPVIPYP